LRPADSAIPDAFHGVSFRNVPVARPANPEGLNLFRSTLRPSWRFVFDHPAHLIAFGGGIGLVPWAPGTFGTLLGFPLFWLFGRHSSALEFGAALTAAFALGVWACAVTGRHIGNADHGGMVWDEAVAFALVLWFVPGTALWQGLAFLLFRLFDIAKPPPIRHYDRTVRGGFGAMLDDVLAAFYTLIVLAIAKTALG
jgi:phosphatidylglycerophosphatase A